MTGRRARAICVSGVLTALVACTQTIEQPRSDITRADVAEVLSRVSAVEARQRHRLGTSLLEASLPGQPRTLAVLRHYGYVAPTSAAFTRAAFTLGSRCGRTCIYIDVLDERVTGVESETETKAGLGSPGARRYVLDVAVRPSATLLARALARAQAIRCPLDLSAPTVLPPDGAIAKAIFFLEEEPRGVVRSDGPVPTTALAFGCPGLR